ncbi:Uncharacterised protein [Mycobacteroides abscessus subsp. abscessus]|uniref:hypothetical protein n=1 Tax=Mycobacteroides abscessus TaxID=36809 RepID=UPI0009259BDA|nr:hypothetical protein [Mycobacteroides abscessus]SIJ21811.1 Uncharacterised protein [Mycobacteroides abscessus subsp. abscessus]SLH38758.1 Uncharacterised protein [Mycobacteroides abscessus subsp. abscessus]
MHDIIISQIRDDDDKVITFASTDPEGLIVTGETTGEIVDVDVDEARVRSLGPEGFGELFVACAQAFFVSRYNTPEQAMNGSYD